MGDYYDRARPHIEALAVKLEDMGLDPRQVCDALLATAAGLGVAFDDAAHVAELLRSLANKVEAGAYAPPEPAPLN